MKGLRSRTLAGVGAGAAIVALALVAGCGEKDETTPATLDITATGEKKKATITAPTSVKGGLVTVNLTNSGKQPASAQLVRFADGHTADEALKIVAGGEDLEIPTWLHAEGGVAGTAPGAKGSATVNLEPGQYVVINDSSEGDKQPSAELTVTEGEAGELPATDATVTAAAASGGNYEWKAEGLKSGPTKLTFVSEGGENTLHHLIAFPIKPDATLDDVKKFFIDEKGPPPFAGEEGSEQETAVLDGDKSEVATLDFKPGKWAFACFLPDKGTKPVSHIQKGLLQVYDIK